MSKEHEECRHCSHCKRCRENCFKKHQTPEDKTLADAEAVRHNSMQDGSSSVPRSEALNQRTKTSGDFCLSDMDEDTGFYRKKDVKEFVRRLDEFILQKGVSVYGSNDEALAIVNSINRELKKLAGSKLV